MTPQQFLAQLKQREPEPAYLFLGPEPYQREFCRRALIERVLPGPQDREGGLARHDLDEVSLAAVLEDACSPSLFAPRRVLVVSGAEAATWRPCGIATPPPTPSLGRRPNSPMGSSLRSQAAPPSNAERFRRPASGDCSRCTF